ncbi:zinc finger protein 551-like isoform X2 [Ischnura elegans]|uniref:zinc finger protein 551-like isoform X2 n=1 Tax=Ischnura elegans TaxID=197161 RepID=UPI001ED87274|nr:zinc finger protein 551-like isoform X2 [Ischnura elegans]
MIDCVETMSLITGIFSDSSERNSVDTLCRLCMKNNDNYYDIFSSNLASKMTVKDALNDLVGLQVAVEDGLPANMCPLCLKKLKEFSDFKRICLESDEELRKCSSRNYFRRGNEEGAADVKLESCDDTTDCIQDATQGTSRVECSVQTTEVYIPVTSCQSPRANMLLHVKEEDEDPLREGDYPIGHTTAPGGISSNVLDPLATHELPTFTTNGYLNENWTVACVSTKEEVGLPALDQVPLRTTSTSYVLAERNIKIDPGDYFIVPSASERLMESKSEVSSLGEGGNVTDGELEKCVALNESDISGDGGAMTVAAGGGDALHITDSLRTAGVSENGIRGTEAVVGGEEEKSFCLKENPGNSCGFNGNLYHCFNCRDVFNTKNDLVKHMGICLCGSDLDVGAGSSKGQDKPLKNVASSEERDRSCEPTTSKTLKGQKRKRNGLREKGNGPLLKGQGDSVKTAVSIEESSVPCEPNTCEIAEGLRRKGKGVMQKGNVHHKGGIFGGMGEKKSVSRSSLEGGKPRAPSRSSSGVGKGRNLVGASGGEMLHSCSVCCKVFTQGSILEKHMRTHSEDRPYSCSECDKSFSQRSILTNHMRKHAVEKPFSCSDCAKAFSSKGNLVMHLRTHSGEKPYACSVCGKSFNASNNLTKHMRTHEGKNPHTCGECSKSFPTASRFIAHVRSHSREKCFDCGICGKFFTRSHTLNCHLRTHTGEKPYSCDDCAKSFATKTNLTRHVLTHSGERPFSCGDCEKSFALRGNLVIHLRSHTGEKPYSCRICGKSFNASNNLTKHMRTHT